MFAIALAMLMLGFSPQPATTVAGGAASPSGKPTILGESNPLRGLPALRKKHFSWPFPQAGNLGRGPKGGYLTNASTSFLGGFLHDYVRITGSCPLSLAHTNQLEVTTCVRLCATNAADPKGCLAINYSPWYAKFPSYDPTITGPAEEAEMSYFSGYGARPAAAGAAGRGDAVRPTYELLRMHDGHIWLRLASASRRRLAMVWPPFALLKSPTVSRLLHLLTDCLPRRRGTSNLSVSLGKYSREAECYYSCGWCPNTRNPSNNWLPGICVQVSHNSHGGSCDDAAGLHCATEGTAGRYTCPAHGVNEANGSVNLLATEEPLLRPPPARERHGAYLRPHSRPYYWAPAGNPRCPDFHDHISYCKHCEPNSPEYGQLLCGRIAAGAPIPGAESGEVFTEASARLHCPRTFFGPSSGGAWRPKIDGATLPQYSNVKCGWCERPGTATDGVTLLPHCQVTNFEGIEFEAMGGAVGSSCPCAESYDPATTAIPVLYQPDTAMIFDGITNPNNRWCRRCPILSWDESEACYQNINPGCTPAPWSGPMCQDLETQSELVGALETDLTSADPLQNTNVDAQKDLLESKLLRVIFWIMAATVGTVSVGGSLIFCTRVKRFRTQERAFKPSRGAAVATATAQSTKGSGDGSQP